MITLITLCGFLIYCSLYLKNLIFKDFFYFKNVLNYLFFSLYYLFFLFVINLLIFIKDIRTFFVIISIIFI